MEYSALIQYYQELRIALFITGFTLGAFLFSMKAMIIKTMKEDYYDKERYLLEISELRKTGHSSGYYTTLTNFSRLLIMSIWVSLVSSILQITLGYWKNDYAVALCLLTALASWVLVGKAIYHVGENWKALLELAEKAAREKYDEGPGGTAE